MKLEVLSVHDRAINAFGRPFCVPAVGAAVRGFTDECKNPDSEIGKHPDDYSLYHLGSFDDSSGAFVLFPQPKFVLKGNMELQLVKEVARA